MMTLRMKMFIVMGIRYCSLQCTYLFVYKQLGYFMEAIESERVMWKMVNSGALKYRQSVHSWDILASHSVMFIRRNEVINITCSQCRWRRQLRYSVEVLIFTAFDFCQFLDSGIHFSCMFAWISGSQPVGRDLTWGRHRFSLGSQLIVRH